MCFIMLLFIKMMRVMYLVFLQQPAMLLNKNKRHNMLGA